MFVSSYGLGITSGDTGVTTPRGISAWIDRRRLEILDTVLDGRMEWSLWHTFAEFTPGLVASGAIAYLLVSDLLLPSLGGEPQEEDHGPTDVDAASPPASA